MMMMMITVATIIGTVIEARMAKQCSIESATIILLAVQPMKTLPSPVSLSRG